MSLFDLGQYNVGTPFVKTFPCLTPAQTFPCLIQKTSILFAHFLVCTMRSQMGGYFQHKHLFIFKNKVISLFIYTQNYVHVEYLRVCKVNVFHKTAVMFPHVWEVVITLWVSILYIYIQVHKPKHSILSSHRSIKHRSAGSLFIMWCHFSFYSFFSFSSFISTSWSFAAALLDVSCGCSSRTLVPTFVGAESLQTKRTF